MNKEAQKKALLEYWNGKGIVVHRRMTKDIHAALTTALKDYTFEELCTFVDFYATILEPKVADSEKQYWWSHKWNLYEFLKRGIRKFDGQTLDTYKKFQRIKTTQPEATILRGKK